MKIKYIFIALFFISIGVIAQEKQDEFIESGDQIEAIFYHDNGVISQTGSYNKQKKLHGEWISYNDKGLKTTVAKYNNGEKVDTWLFYQNNLINEVTYLNSKISKVKIWEATNVEIVSNR
jgi:antitoxin component YwqK of YwqJK toxin-antitoxin module|tara:strand:+ start:21832 stop:22191 length:360 start_codon:yes stop_codon:yes gene_type:complete